MKVRNRTFLLLTLAVGVVVMLAACAKVDSTFSSTNTGSDGLALRGFDAVAYFAVDNAVKGNARYEFAWNGARWLFSSEENMKKFQANPEAYAPQFGGYCSYAVSKGYTANGDPNAWKIVDGKLYLNYSPEVKKMWEQEQTERIKQGEKNWSEFKIKKPEHKG